MSTNFTGVTFAKQKVTPSDDAIIRRAILPDGILYGCEITYSGSTLTMAAGQLLICGRQIRHPASQNWAVVDATSGYARLLLTIDLTKTATKETFEQVVDSIEYASSEDGFPDLEQTDINVSGARYQIVACVVSLGTGGITGIVSQLGKSVVESSGGLNFSVVGGTAQPSDPAENMIWANTDVDITSYIFSPVEPAEPTEGMLWISTGSSSPVAFDALKKGGILICPISASQYIDGAWVSVTAKSYQNGELVDWIVYLFNNGDNEPVSGGWKSVASTYNGYGSGTPTLTVGNTLQCDNSNGATGYVRHGDVVDMTPYTMVHMSGTHTYVSGSQNYNRPVILRDGCSDWFTGKSSDVLVDTGSMGYGDFEDFQIDITDVNEEALVCWGFYGYSSSARTSVAIREIWFT